MKQDPFKIKKLAIEKLREKVPSRIEVLKAFDSRLLDYYDDLCNYSSCIVDDENDHHNCDEILGAIKFLRLTEEYICDLEMAKSVIYSYEGEWRKDGKRWIHVSGGLRHPGSSGPTYYRLQPFQIFIICSIFGLRFEANTYQEEGTRELLPTEFERDGYIWDSRRMCSEFILFTPRKTAKTQFSAFIQLCFFMFGDANAECYCAANSESQSKILYSRTKALIHQLDPDEKLIRFTDTECNWKIGTMRSAILASLSAGGKTKDGLFAQLCSADEYGSAPYVGGKSDMGRLVSVLESSMGPRREPLTFITTTAGTINSGPFIEKLQSTRLQLLSELNDSSEHQESEDRHMCLLLHPDEWEKSEDFLFSHKNVRRKINPMLGIIVQHSFYDDEISKARTDGIDKLADVISKDFNVYRASAVDEWIKSAEIMPLQRTMRVDDCTADKDWIVFVGCDFSKGDDLNGNGYLCFNMKTHNFFCDGDFYISEQACNKSPICDLLRQWASEGWLHITPGATFDPAVVVSRIVELHNKGVNFAMFGYDPFNAKLVVNALAAWIYDLSQERGELIDPKDIIISVRQNYATYNPLVNEFDYLIHRTEINYEGKSVHAPLVNFSASPLWGWMFDNCVLAESNDGMSNRKPVKKSSAASCKVDGVQMILTALHLFDILNNRENLTDN